MEERAAESSLPLTAKQTELTITTNLPPIDHHGEIVEIVGADSIRVRLPFKAEYLGAEPWQDGSGQVFSGPMVMGLRRYRDVLLRAGRDGHGRHSR